jgi:hypothetical protein
MILQKIILKKSSNLMNYKIIELIIQSESSNSFFLPLVAALGAGFETGATKSSSSPAKRLFAF